MTLHLITSKEQHKFIEQRLFKYIGYELHIEIPQYLVKHGNYKVSIFLTDSNLETISNILVNAPPSLLQYSFDHLVVWAYLQSMLGNLTLSDAITASYMATQTFPKIPIVEWSLSVNNETKASSNPLLYLGSDYEYLLPDLYRLHSYSDVSKVSFSPIMRSDTAVFWNVPKAAESLWDLRAGSKSTLKDLIFDKVNDKKILHGRIGKPNQLFSLFSVLSDRTFEIDPTLSTEVNNTKIKIINSLFSFDYFETSGYLFSKENFLKVTLLGA